PARQPDPCVSVAPPGANLALGALANASAEESDSYQAARATDGSMGTWWSAGDGPVQWLEVDLGTFETVGEVSVVIGNVAPAGRRVYRVSTGGPGDGGATSFAGEIAGEAVAGGMLTLKLATPIENVR